MTLEEAKGLHPGDVLHNGLCRRFIGPRGGVKEFVERWRVSGQVKTWKTRPDEVKVPIKYGLRTSTYIHQWTIQYWHREENCKPEEVRA